MKLSIPEEWLGLEKQGCVYPGYSDQNKMLHKLDSHDL